MRRLRGADITRALTTGKLGGEPSTIRARWREHGARTLDIVKDIQPMTFFRNHSAAVLQHLKATRRPVVLTVNGRAAAVVQDAEAYQQLLDLAAQANAAEGIRQGQEDLASGRTRSARSVFDELRGEYGIPR